MKTQRNNLVQRNAIGISIAAAAFGGWQTTACAQSSVTLYGLLSVGVGYVSNSGGSKLFSLVSGPQQPPRLGFRGQEDLGNGTRAIFTLENGFSMTNGSLGQGGRMFGRQAFVGLSNDAVGTVTFGRQYDDMSQELYWSESASIFAAVGARIGDTDDAFGTLRFNNSVRYTSPTVYGLTFAGMYALSNSTAFADNSGFSFGANYVRGALKVGLAVVQYNRPSSSTNTSGAIDNSAYGYTSPFTTSLGGAAVQTQRIVGLGATYDFGYVAATAGYSNVLFKYLDTSGLRIQNAELTLTRRITPSWLLGAAYIYTTGDYSAGQQVHYNQVNLGTVYSLSKRTDLFLVGMAQRAGGDAKYAQIYSTSASTTRNQLEVISGIRVRF